MSWFFNYTNRPETNTLLFGNGARPYSNDTPQRNNDDDTYNEREREMENDEIDESEASSISDNSDNSEDGEEGNESEVSSSDEDMGLTPRHYDDILTEYLNNIQTIRWSIRQTIDNQNAFMSRVQEQFNNLNTHSILLHELLLSNTDLSDVIYDNRERNHRRAAVHRIPHRRTDPQSATATLHRAYPQAQPQPQQAVATTVAQPATNNSTGNTQINPWFMDPNNRPLWGWGNQGLAGTGTATGLGSVWDRIDWTSPLTDVVVAPSQEQIEQACSTVAFNSINEELRYYERCPISFLVFNDDTAVMRINHCGHYFDPDSLSGWFRNSVVCPVCRHDIRVNNSAPAIATTASASAISGNGTTNAPLPRVRPNNYYYEFTTTIPTTNNNSQVSFDEIFNNIYSAFASMPMPNVQTTTGTSNSSETNLNNQTG